MEMDKPKVDTLDEASKPSPIANIAPVELKEELKGEKKEKRRYKTLSDESKKIRAENALLARKKRLEKIKKERDMTDSQRMQLQLEKDKELTKIIMDKISEIKQTEPLVKEDTEDEDDIEINDNINNDDVIKKLIKLKVKKEIKKQKEKDDKLKIETEKQNAIKQEIDELKKETLHTRTELQRIKVGKSVNGYKIMVNQPL